MTKSPALYRVILLVWAALFGLALLTTAGSLSREITQRPVAGYSPWSPCCSSDTSG
ncbi:Hypothetical protein PFR_JS12-1_389 [Propionibacterium freudenreichii]|uniref:hypothetical protein n=1 Tax=Propionibacterium freudenreichii TaxID=1744 RepID=UPI000BC2F65B|nr:hypothetical protein [Propionibacterium freudenreichii]SBN94773.1 Hypothetical protein PFR_JS12-2_389 [Propionibacterium freudenreichii]SCC96357.1 Hypothetical protein PFR_JS12-1_389 [Propionibacterium freudenreichii]